MDVKKYLVKVADEGNAVFISSQCFYRDTSLHVLIKSLEFRAVHPLLCGIRIIAIQLLCCGFTDARRIGVPIGATRGKKKQQDETRSEERRVGKEGRSRVAEESEKD